MNAQHAVGEHTQDITEDSLDFVWRNWYGIVYNRAEMVIVVVVRRVKYHMPADDADNDDDGC